MVFIKTLKVGFLYYQPFYRWEDRGTRSPQLAMVEPGWTWPAWLHSFPQAEHQGMEHAGRCSDGWELPVLILHVMPQLKVCYQFLTVPQTVGSHELTVNKPLNIFLHTLILSHSNPLLSSSSWFYGLCLAWPNYHPPVLFPMPHKAFLQPFFSVPLLWKESEKAKEEFRL